MKYVRLKLTELPRIMYSHSCILKNMDPSHRNNPYFELTLFEEGKYRLDMPGFSYLGGGEEYIFSPADVPYSIRNLGERVRQSCVAFFFGGEAQIVEESEVVFEKYNNVVLVRNESIYVPIAGKFRLNDHSAVLLRRIIEENRQGLRYTNVKCAGLIVELLISLASAAAEKLVAERGEESVPSNRYYCDRIDAYLRDHYAEDVNMNAVAEFVGLHPNYVSAIYKKETGVTVINALRSIRMERAKRLLLMRRYQIKEIARMVGYEDENYFSGVFRKTEGVSPSEYVSSLLKKE